MNIKRSDLKLYARRALKGNWGTVIGAMLVCMGITYVFVIVLEAVMVAALGAGFNTLFQGFSAAPALASAGGFSAGVLIVAMIVLYFVYLVALLLMGVGYQRLYLDVAAGRKAKVSTLFWAFTHKPWKFILISILIALLEGITTLPVCIMSVAAAVTGGSGFAAIFLIVYGILFIIIYAYVLLTFSQFYLILVEDPEKGIFDALAESQRLMKGKRGSYFVLYLSFIGITLLGALSCGLAALWLSPYMGCTLALFYLALKGAVPESLKRSPFRAGAAGAYGGSPVYPEPPAPRYYPQPQETPQDAVNQQPPQAPQDAGYQQPPQTSQDACYQQPVQTDPSSDGANPPDAPQA